MKLVFQKETINFRECFISNKYKCVKYGAWKAYFKPSNWKSWGNACEYTNMGNSPDYKSLKQAQRACERHYKKFGDSPTENQHLEVIN